MSEVKRPTAEQMAKFKKNANDQSLSAEVRAKFKAIVDKFENVTEEIGEDVVKDVEPKKRGRKPATEKKTPAPKKAVGTKKSVDDIEKAKAEIKRKTGKTEEECESIIEQYRALRTKAQEGKRKAEQASAENKKRVDKLDNKGDLIEGTNVKTADAVIETTAKDVAEKIEQQIEAVEEKAEKEAKAEVAKDNTIKTPKAKKEAVQEKVDEKVKKETKVVVERVVIDTSALLTSIATSLGKFDKDSQKEFLIKLRSDIDKLLAKYAFGGMTDGAVQMMNIQQSNMSSSSVNPTMFAKGGGVDGEDYRKLILKKFINKVGNNKDQFVTKYGTLNGDYENLRLSVNVNEITDRQKIDLKQWAEEVSEKEFLDQSNNGEYLDFDGLLDLSKESIISLNQILNREFNKNDYYFSYALLPRGYDFYVEGISYANGGGVNRLPSYFFKGGKYVNLIKYSVDDQRFEEYENYQDALEDFNKLKSGHNVSLLKFDNEGRGESKTLKISDLARKKIFTDGTKYAKGGVVGQEIVFDYNGEETKGVIKDISNLGDYVVTTDNGRTLLAQPDLDVISLGAIRQQGMEQRKKRFGLFDEGGNVSDLDYNDILAVLEDKLTEAVANDIPNDFEYAYNATGEEVEHQSRDGFIAYTDGGFEVRWFEYLSQFYSSGNSLPTSALDKEKDRQIEYNFQLAKERFTEEYPEIVEELGEENIDYNSLYEAGYESEAEELSEMEMDFDGDETIMCEVGAYYYTPNNDRGIEGEHTLRLFGLVNLESPYHRSGNLEDSFNIDITFNSIEELEEKVDAGLKEIIDWFNGSNYDESTDKLRIVRMAKGGMIEHGLRLGDKIVGKGIRTIKVEDSENKKHIVNLNTGTREDSFKKGGNISSMLRNRRGM